MDTVAIKGTARKDVGKKSTKALRREGLFPCVIYGHGDATHFSTDLKNVKALIYTPNFKLAEIELDGKTYKCILKDKHFHPVTDKIANLEFMELIDDRKFKTDVPVRVEGTAEGVKAGGILLQNLRKITIKTTPAYLVDQLTIDVTALAIGQAVRVRDIAEIDGVEIMNEGGTPIALIAVPRSMKSAEAEGEEGAEGAEGDAAAEGAEGSTEGGGE